MLGEFVRAFFSVIRSPLLLVVAAIGLLASLLAWLWLQEPLVTLFSAVLGGALNEAGGLDTVSFLFLGFLEEWLAIILLLLVLILINAWVTLVFARFAVRQQEKKIEVGSSVRFGFVRILRLIGWTLFVVLILLAWLVVFLGIQAIGSAVSILGIILLLLWILVTIFLGLVFALVVPILGVEDCTIQHALKKSVFLVRKNLGSVLVFFVVLGIVLSALSLLGSLAFDAFEDETMFLVVAFVLLLLQSVLANLSVPFFYLQKRVVS